MNVNIFIVIWLVVWNMNVMSFHIDWEFHPDKVHHFSEGFKPPTRYIIH